MAKTPEERLETRQVRELRKQIIKLRRENAALRKRNSRIENDFAESQEEELYESMENDPVPPEVQKSEDQECPVCGGRNIYVMILRGLLYYRCQDEQCGSKGKLPK